MYIFDTCVVIDLARGNKYSSDILTFIKKEMIIPPYLISIITYTEFLSNPEFTNEEVIDADNLLTNFYKIIPYENLHAFLAASLRRERIKNATSQNLRKGIADYILIGTCMYESEQQDEIFKLVTRDNYLLDNFPDYTINPCAG